jgi:ketosteroid isomerase-like protein
LKLNLFLEIIFNDHSPISKNYKYLNVMKKTTFLLALILVFTSLGYTCCKNQEMTFTDKDSEEIRSTSENAIKKYVLDKDTKAYVNTYYADEATVLMPNMEPVKGREAIMTLLGGYSDIKMEFRINDISGNGNIAYVFGYYTMKDGSDNIMDQGKYIEVWKKGSDGKWLTIYDISNSNLPLSSTAMKTE